MEINWQVMGILISLALAWHGMLLGIIKWLIDRHFRQMDERLNAISRLEQKILEMQAAMPNEYLRRDDWIRFASVIEAKLDRLMMRDNTWRR